MIRRVVSLVGATALLMIPLTAPAQESGTVELFAQFPGVKVEPGSSASFDIEVSGTPGAVAPLSVRGLDWTATFRGNGTTIERVAVDGDEETTQMIRLDVQVPADAADGTYPFTALAGAETLDLSITVEAGAVGSVTLTPDFPGLRGPSDADFPFRVTVRNDTAADVELELEAFGPEGWTVTAEPASQSRAAAITVNAGSSATVNLTAEPAIGAEAGLYEVGMRAIGAGSTAELTVQVELIGEQAMDITTVDQRLNAEVTIGETTELPIVVRNTGTAPLLAVEITSSAPSGWEVAIEPAAVDLIEPGGFITVTALITPASDALAGDYQLTFRASNQQVSDAMEIRTTVTPSAFWGIVGVGLIALTLAGLAVVFRVFGRR